MRNGLWYLVIEAAQDLQKEMRALRAADIAEDKNTEYWDKVCKMATSTKRDSLNGLGNRITKFVFPILDETREKRDRARALQKREEADIGVDKNPERGERLADGMKNGDGEETGHMVENPGTGFGEGAVKQEHEAEDETQAGKSGPQ